MRRVAWLLLLVVILTAGCTIEVTVYVGPAGRGRTTTTFVLSPEERRQLQSFPNARSYLAAWQRTLTRHGVRAEQFSLESGRFTMVRPFENLSDLRLAQGAASRSWTAIRREVTPLAVFWTLTARVDTRDLLPREAASRNAFVGQEVERRLRQSILVYRVRLPGELAASTGDRAGEGEQVQWRIPLGEMRVVRAKSRVHVEPARTVVMLGFGSAGLVALLSAGWIGWLWLSGPGGAR